MALIGYIRVSSVGQSLEVQRDKMIAAGVEPDHIYEEKRSGLDSDRPVLKEALRFARKGDVFFVSRVDRLARSTNDLHRIIHELKEKGVGFRCIDQAEIDTTTNNGMLMFGILSAIAQFETGLRAERQMDGIAKARAVGTKFGRKAKATEDVTLGIRKMRDKGMLIREIMQKTGLSKATVYRALGSAE
ncbi:DNA invertase Pin-like site-specific DNA recombinase [Pararhizobium capsulatum DSM 1112]|uniref:DNA invertase Pin-like site-specific DNA recombinase n=1 Tax=Pararhizobium capsulatum DSM 1112 TaxID=1121113 RepID=A0ABU0BN15_9HYPH|nr:recombinase family protein [Pararhizobium capsulatum]MDQ0319650.1 DNA invertase Pin-like site-specific DNA recombinase [Pararhizobium capsulatum DSM 1112]